jgi:flagellar biogenesis protein FliO
MNRLLLIAVLAIFVLVRIWFMVRIIRQRRARKDR